MLTAIDGFIICTTRAQPRRGSPEHSWVRLRGGSTHHGARFERPHLNTARLRLVSRPIGFAVEYQCEALFRLVAPEDEQASDCGKMLGLSNQGDLI